MLLGCNLYTWTWPGNLILWGVPKLLFLTVTSDTLSIGHGLCFTPLTPVTSVPTSPDWWRLWGRWSSRWRCCWGGRAASWTPARTGCCPETPAKRKLELNMINWLFVFMGCSPSNKSQIENGDYYMACHDPNLWWEILLATTKAIYYVLRLSFPTKDI